MTVSRRSTRFGRSCSLMELRTPAEMAILEDVRVAFGLSPADSEAARTRVLEMLAD